MEYVEHVQIKYTESEMAEFGKRLARLEQELDQLALRRKESMDDYKAQISTVKEAISKISKEVDRGFKVTEHTCDVILDSPTKGLKSFVDQATLETIRVVPMTVQECGGSLMGAAE